MWWWSGWCTGMRCVCVCVKFSGGCNSACSFNKCLNNDKKLCFLNIYICLWYTDDEAVCMRTLCVSILLSVCLSLIILLCLHLCQVRLNKKRDTERKCKSVIEFAFGIYFLFAYLIQLTLLCLKNQSGPSLYYHL